MSATLPDVIDEELLYCGLCLRSYSDEPKILPCLHIFCKTCLQRHVEKQSMNNKPPLPRKPSYLAGNPRHSRRKSPPPRPQNKQLNGSDENVQQQTEHVDSFGNLAGNNRSGFSSDSEDDHYEEFPPSPINMGDNDPQLEVSIPLEDSPLLRHKVERQSTCKYEDLDVGDSSSWLLDIPAEMAPSPPPLSPHEYLPMKRKPRDRWTPPLPKPRKNASSSSAAESASTVAEDAEDSSYEVPVNNTPSSSNRNTVYVYDEMDNPMLKQSKSDWDIAGEVPDDRFSRSMSMEDLDADLDGQVPCYYTGPSSPVPAPRPRKRKSREKSPVTCSNPALPPRMVPLRRKSDQMCGVGNQRSISNNYSSSPTSFKKATMFPLPAMEPAPDSVQFTCPTCSQEHTIPTTGLSGYRTCSFVTSLQETVSSQSASPKTCDNCEVKEAAFKCLECVHYLCSGCKEAHHWLKITKSHRVMTLKQLQSGKYQREMLQRLHQTSCEFHPKSEASFFCAQCDRAICATCQEQQHQGHSCASLESASKRDRQFLGTLLEGLHQQEKAFESHVTSLSKYEEKCLQDKNDLIDAVTNQKQKINQILEEVYSELVRQIGVHYDEEITRTEDIMRENNNLISSVRQTSRITDQLLKHGKHGDVVAMTTNIKHTFHRFHDLTPKALENQLEIEFEPSPIEEEDLLSVLGRAIKRQVHTDTPLINMHKAFHEEKTHHTKEIPSLLHEFRTKTSNDAKGCKPTGIALMKNNNIVVVDDINKKLKIFEKNGALVKELCPKGDDALVDPWDVAITKYGNFAVTDKGAGVVKIMDPEGEVVSSFGPHLKQPWGIATNSLGDIIVTDPVCHAVFIHDTAGEMKYSLGTSDQGRLFYCPEYVAVNHNDDMIVSDFEKHCVVIFDSIGRFLMRVGQKGRSCHEFNVPCGLTCDSNGDIYIADYNNQRITQLDMNGRFKSYLLTMVDHLLMPQALEIDDKGHLIVIDGNNIKIFGDKSEKIAPEEPKPKLEERTVKLRRDNVLEKRSHSPYQKPLPSPPEEKDKSNPESPIADMIQTMTLSSSPKSKVEISIRTIPASALDHCNNINGGMLYDEPKSSEDSYDTPNPTVSYDVPKPSDCNYKNTQHGVYHEDPPVEFDKKYETLVSGKDTVDSCDKETEKKYGNIVGNVTDDQLPLPVAKETKRLSIGKSKPKSADPSIEREKPLRKSMNALTRKLSKKSKKKKQKELEKQEQEEAAARAAAEDNASNTSLEQSIDDRSMDKSMDKSMDMAKIETTV